MTFIADILMRTFGRPRGVLGRLGGLIMARTNEDCAAWVIGRLDIQPQDKVIEIGFGPGVAVQLMIRLIPSSFVAGVDASKEMVGQATARNAKAVESRRVELRHGSVENLPFTDHSFDKALAINSMQVWPDATTGLQEMRRVMKTGGKIALGFTPYFRAIEGRNVRYAENRGFCEHVHRRIGERVLCSWAQTMSNEIRHAESSKHSAKRHWK